MKKKFLTFVLALIFVIPCMFAIAGCGEKPCTHANTTHGLCDCGHYAGTTLTVNETHGGINMEKGETVYFRYKVEQGQHYGRSGNKILDNEVKYFVKNNNKWLPLNGDNYRVIDNVPSDGYVYIEITAGAKTLDASINMYKACHSEGNLYEGNKVVIDLDELSEEHSNEYYCCMYEATAGRYLIYTLSDFVEFPSIYDAENNLLNGSLYKQGGNFYLTLEEDTDLYFHFYFNSAEDSETSHFTIQNVTE